MKHSRILIAILLLAYKQMSFSCVLSPTMKMSDEKFKSFIFNINVEAINQHKSENILSQKVFGSSNPYRFKAIFSENNKSEIKSINTVVCLSQDKLWVCESKKEMAAPIKETDSYSIIQGEISQEKAKLVSSFVINSAKNKLQPIKSGTPIDIRYVSNELIIANLGNGEYKISLNNIPCFDIEIIVKESSCNGNDCEFELLSYKENHYA